MAGQVKLGSRVVHRKTGLRGIIIERAPHAVCGVIYGIQFDDTTNPVLLWYARAELVVQADLEPEASPEPEDQRVSEHLEK